MTTIADRAAFAARDEKAGIYLAGVRASVAAGGKLMEARASLMAGAYGARAAQFIQKAAVEPGRVSGSSWGHQLAELQPAAGAFVELVRMGSVLGKLGGFRRVPFRVRVPRQTSGAAAQWVTEGGVLPATSGAFDTVLFEHGGIAGIIIITKELAKLSDAEALLNVDLTRAVREFEDYAFLNPSQAGSADTPSSITYGASSVAATGATEAALKADIRSLIDALIGGGSNLDAAVLVMSKKRALAISQMDVGRDLGLNGGRLLGLDVVTTTSAALADGDSPASDIIVAVDPSLVLLAQGDIETSAAEHGSIQANTTPDSPESGSSVVVPLWQHDLVALKVIEHVYWQRARAGACAYITGAAYAE